MAKDNEQLDVMPENVASNPEANADMLHGHATKIMAQPDLSYTDHSDLAAIASHANTGASTLESIYNRAFPKDDTGFKYEEGAQDMEHDSSQTIASVLKHPNTPAYLAEDFLDRHYMSDGSYDRNREALDAAQAKADPKKINSLIDKWIAHPEDTGRGDKLTGSPDHYFKLLQEHANETNAETPQAKKRAQALSGMSRAKHTPKSIDKMINYLTDKNTPENNKRLASDILSQLPKHQKALTSSQINKLSSIWEGRIASAGNDRDWESTEALSELVKHPNADSDMVAKYAKSRKGDYAAEDVKRAALASPKLPKETKKSIINGLDSASWEDKRYADAILENPTLTEEDVTELYAKGFQDKAVLSPHASPQLIKDYTDHAMNSTESARNLLNRDELPEDSLLSLVSHKNQNVAEEALKHSSVNMNVINAALKRKAKKVQDAAARHPAVAKKMLVDRLLSGKLSPAAFLSKENFEALGKEVPEQAIHHMSEQLSWAGKPSDYQAQDEENNKVKLWLANGGAGKVPKHIRDQHRNEIIDRFSELTNNPENEYNSRGHSIAYQNVISKWAGQGHPHAEQALLSRPRRLLQVNFDENNDDGSAKFRPEFLEKAHGILESRDLRSDSDYGNRQSVQRQKLSQIYKNPNTPDHIFMKGVNDPKTYDYVGSYADEWGAKQTMFDKRWGSLPEEQRRRLFSDMTRVSPKANEAIMRSESAPADIWRGAWLNTPADERDDLLTNSNVRENMDVDSAAETIVNNRSGHGLKVLESIGDKALPALTKAMAMAEDGNWYGNLAKYDRSIVDAHEKKNWEFGGNEAIAQAAHKEANPENVDAGLTIALIAARAKDEILGKNYYGYMQEGEPQRVFNKIAADLQSVADNTFPNDPQRQQEFVNAQWINAIANLGDSKLVGSARRQDPKSMDFLMNMPEPYSENIREMALSKGLISEEAAAQYTQNDPERVSKYLDGASPDSKKEYIRQLIDSGAVGGAGMYTGAIHKHMRPGIFYTRNDDAAEKGLKAAAGYSRLVDHLANAGDYDAIKSLPDTFDTAGNSRNSVPVATKKALARAFTEKIKSLDVPNHVKTDLLLHTLRSMNEKGIAPSSAYKDALKDAQNSGDLRTILQVAQETGSKTAIAGLLKGLDRAATLPNSDFFNMILDIPSDNLSTTQVKKIGEMASKRLLTEQDPNELEGHADKLTAQFGKIMKSSRDPETASAAMRGAVQMAMLPHEGAAQFAASNVVKQMGNDNIPLSQRIEAWKSIPHSVAEDLDTPYILDDLINHPDIVADSTSGWKLSALAAHAREMTEENAKIVANRVLSNPNLPASTYESLAQSMMSNPNADAQDTLNTLKAINQTDLISHLDKFNERGRPMSAKLLPEVAKQIDETVQSPRDGVAPLSDAHLLQVSHNLMALTEQLEHMDNNSDDHALEAGEQALNTTRKLQAAAHGPNVSEAVKRNVVHTSTSVYQTSINRGMKYGRFEPEQQLEVLRGIESSKSLMQSTEDSKDWTKNQYSELIEGWTRTAKNLSEEQWKSALDDSPVAIFALSGRESIDSAIFSAANLDKNLEKSPHLITELKTWPEKLAEKDVHTISPKLLELGLKHAEQMPSKDVKEYLSNIMARTPHLVDANMFRRYLDYMSDDHKFEATAQALESGAGGKDTLDFATQHAKEHKNGHLIDSIYSSPFLDLANGMELWNDMYAGEEKQWYGSDAQHNAAHALVKNRNAPSELMAQIVPAAIKKGIFEMNRLPKELKQHPNIPKPLFDKIAQEIGPGMNHKDAILGNPTYGSELFRQIPVTVPQSVPNVDRSNMVTSVSHSTASDRLSQLLPIIPAQGMPWVDFKRANPKLEHIPEIKRLFMSKKNQTVMPEDVVKAAKDAGKEFTITYTKWDGIQRHNTQDPNLVMQLNLGPQTDQAFKDDKDLQEFYQFAIDSFSGHPITQKIGSWLRIDTGSGKDGWIIEEFQSDFGPTMSRIIKNYANRGNMKINGKQVSAERMEQLHQKVVDMTEGWYHASLKAIEELARKQGVKNLYIHGEGIRAELSGLNSDKELPVRVREMYSKNPEKLGWAKIDYSDYPKHDKRLLSEAKKAGFPTYAWHKKLS